MADKPAIAHRARLIAAGAVILPFLLAVILSACVHTPVSATVRIDSSTPESFHASWKRLNKSLTSQQRSELSLAILPIALGKYKSLVDAPPALLNTGVARIQFVSRSMDDICRDSGSRAKAIDQAGRGRPSSVRASPQPRLSSSSSRCRQRSPGFLDRRWNSDRRGGTI